MGIGSESDFNIIQAYNRHVDIIAPLFDAYRVFYGQPANPERSKQFLAARIGVRDTVVFLAVKGEEPQEEALGFAILYPSFSSVLAASVWILNDIYVDEQVRRKGVASALIQRARKLAYDAGARRLTLETGTTNESSHALYKALGFTQDDTFCTYILDI